MKKILNNKFLFILLTIYLIILILEKINIIDIICNILCILKPIFWSLLIVFLLLPIKKYLVKKGMPKKESVIFVYIIIIFMMYLIIFNFSPAFIKKISMFIKTIPDLIIQIFNILNIKNIDIQNKIILYLKRILSGFNFDISSTCINLFSSISSFFIGLVISFYMLFEDFSIRKYLKKDIYNLIIRINDVLIHYVKATIISSLAVFILSTIVFIIFNIPNALVYGLLCGITNIIPYIGPYIGGSIPSIIAFGINTNTGIFVVLSIIIVQIIESNIIHPIIISKSINIHPIVSILSLLIFTNLFGFIGAVLSIPITIILREVYLYIKMLYN